MKTVHGCCAALAFGLLAQAASAATVVVPAAFAATEGGSSFGYSVAFTYQQVYASSLLTGIAPGSVIKGFSMRLNGGSSTGPSSAVNVANFDVRIGKSNFAPGSLTTNFASNQGADTVLARSGALSIAANSYTGGAGPNPFGPEIAFTTPYTYTGGDLLLSVSTTDFTSSLTMDGNTGAATTGQEIQALIYNATTSTDSFPGYTLIVQFDVVPEPASLGLIAAAGVMALRRNRSRFAPNA